MNEHSGSARSLGTAQFYREVGSRIREIRLNKKTFTQEALAISVGLTRTSLTNIEKGRQKLLLHTFSQIASALGVTPNDLLPQNSTVLKNMGVELPAELPPAERGFIERAMSPGGIYESIETTRHSGTRKQTASTKRHSRAAS